MVLKPACCWSTAALRVCVCVCVCALRSVRNQPEDPSDGKRSRRKRRATFTRVCLELLLLIYMLDFSVILMFWGVVGSWCVCLAFFPLTVVCDWHVRVGGRREGLGVRPRGENQSLLLGLLVDSQFKWRNYSFPFKVKLKTTTKNPPPAVFPLLCPHHRDRSGPTPSLIIVHNFATSANKPVSALMTCFQRYLVS